VFTLRGKLYNNEEQFMADVEYRLLEGAITDVWGELIPIEGERLSDGSNYIIELEGNHKIKCHLQACFRRAMTDIPTRFVYRFARNNTLNIN